MLCRGNISSSKKNFKKFQPKSQVSQVTFPLNIAHLQLSTFQKSQTLAPVFVVAKMLPKGTDFILKQPCHLTPNPFNYRLSRNPDAFPWKASVWFVLTVRTENLLAKRLFWARKKERK